jgi:cell division protein FtsQ
MLAAAGAIAVIAVAAGLGTGHRGERLAAAIGHGVDGKFGDAGFRLKAVHVQGASAIATPDIIKAAQIYKDQPLLGLNLPRMRADIEKVGWVKDARIVRLLPDTLVISVDQRRQLAVWQHAGRSVVIDDHGAVIPGAEPSRFPGLPLVVGAGAADHASEILPLIAQRPKLMGRVEALVRVDDRRWDIRLKDGSLIQLPSATEEAALQELEKLDTRQRILDLGFERIDLRNPDVVAVRPRPKSNPVASGVLVAAGA